MRALDPRLLRRTRSVRPLLAVDTALGLATIAPVIAQATVIAHVVARAFDDASLGDLRADLLLLVLAFAARGLLAWWMEVAGRRAASTTLSELRLELARRRLERDPLATDGHAAGELPVRVRARAGGYARCGARGGDDRRAARRRRLGAPGRPHRARARAGAVPAIQTPRGGIPRERRRTRRGGAHVHAARLRRRRAHARPRGAGQPRQGARAVRGRVVLLSVEAGPRARPL